MICWRSASICSFSFAFSDFASIRPPNQEAASRKGRATRSAPTSKGRKMLAPVLWKPCSTPPSDSRK